MKAISKILALGALACATCLAGNVTLTFDDLPPAGGGGSLPAGYAGYTWSQIYYLTSPLTAASGANYADVSPDNVAFSPGGPATMSSTTPFTFVDAYLTAFWRNRLQMTVQGFLNGTEMFNDTFTIDDNGPTHYLGSSPAMIDALQFTSDGGVPDPQYSSFSTGYQFAIDNLTVSQSTPEPATFALLGSSLLGLVFVRVRRFRR